MSSGWAAWPLDETTYFGFSDPFGSTVTDGGRDDGVLLYVYGRVTAVGNEMNGDTVNGTCASKGWAPSHVSVQKHPSIGSRGCTMIVIHLIDEET
jgi:hypothetical protein